MRCLKVSRTRPLAPAYRNSRQLLRGVILFLGGGEVRPRLSGGPKGEPGLSRGLGGWTMFGGTIGRGRSAVGQVPDGRCSRLITDLRVTLPSNSRSPDAHGWPRHKRGALAVVGWARPAAGWQGSLKVVQGGRSSCATSASKPTAVFVANPAKQGTLREAGERWRAPKEGTGEAFWLVR